MLAVLIPAHNEEALISRCLNSVLAAAAYPGLGGEPVCVVVALDRCSDATADVARAFGVHTVAVEYGNVGRARHAAATLALDLGARWLACTDADSVVPPDWLHGQVRAGADVFCGMVRVDDWEGHPHAVADQYLALHPAHDGHPHVHGANLGVASEWYRKSGGFPPAEAHEDVALVSALRQAGAAISSLCLPVVVTSARRVARAPEGFAGYLSRLAAQSLLPARLSEQ